MRKSFSLFLDLKKPVVKTGLVLLVFLFALLFGSHSGRAQLTNRGGLYVSPETVLVTEQDFSNAAQGRFRNAGTLNVFGGFSNEEETTNEGVLTSREDFLNGEAAVFSNTGRVTSHGSFHNGIAAEFSNKGEVLSHGIFRNGEGAVFTNTGRLTGFAEVFNEVYGSFTNDGEVTSHGLFSNLKFASFTNDGNLLLHADFSNEGQVDYRETGVTHFVSTTQNQHLQGKGETYFKNVVFNNSFATAPFQLSDTLTVEGRVTFERGIVDSDSYGGVFVFEENADYEGASRRSHIDGPVVKRGDRSFTYPVGDQRFYRAASLSEPKDLSEKYETKYFKENSDKFYPHAFKAGEEPGADEPREGTLNYINEGEYWKVIPVVGKSDLLLTLSWDESTTPEEIWRNPEAIHVVRWDVERNMWVDEGGTVNERERTITAPISEYGIFTLGTVALEEELSCEVVVYNGMTPNGDNTNEAFKVEVPSGLGPISVKIFNRWGAKVFESTNYGQNGDLFRGYSEVSGTIGDGKLPTGTYFYTLDYSCGSSKASKAGYLYLSHNE